MKRVVLAAAVLVAGVVIGAPIAEAGWIYVNGRWIKVEAPPEARSRPQYSCSEPRCSRIPTNVFVVLNPRQNGVTVKVQVRKNEGPWKDISIDAGYESKLACDDYNVVRIGDREYSATCGRHYYACYHYPSHAWDIFHVAE